MPSAQMEQLWLRSLYCHEADAKNPYASSYYDDMHDMPPMLLAWDESETLVADSEVIVERLRKNGIECQAKAYPDCFHAFATAGRGARNAGEHGDSAEYSRIYGGAYNCKIMFWAFRQR